ncbi:MAG TPA: ABC transporter substrate-binding protein [Gaiellaceae bacterium]|jgi:branched-chain amino acid transport system substrate-binding protein|nr:ABC transporter substrate-binding protein [Gaiellaceae bacterium]
MTIRIGAAALLLGLAFVGGAQGRTDAASTIKIGAIFDRSGPTSDVGVPYSDGVQAYVAYINSRGGIRGRKIQLLSQDTSYNVARSEAFYQQLRTSGIVAISGWATADTEAFKARVAADRLPYVSASYAESVADPDETPYNFFIAPSYSQQMRIALKWISRQARNRRVKVAVCYSDSPFGRSPLEDGQKYISSKRLRMDYDTSCAMRSGGTDFTAQLTRVRDADYIVVQNTSAPSAALAKDAARLGLKARIVLLNWGADELFVTLAGSARAGAVGIQPFGTTALKVPGLRLPARWLRTHGGGSIHRKGIHYVQGWYTMAVMVAAVRRVVVQRKEVNGPNIKAALETMPPISTGGVTGRIKFTRNYHAGQRASRIFQVIRGRFRQIAPFTTP